MIKIVRPALLAVASLLTLALGGLGGLAIASAADAPAQPLQSSLSVNPVEKFPVSSSGLTFGYVDQGLIDNASARADLVLVTTDEGQEGWAYFAELIPGYYAKTPEEAQRLSTDEPYAVAVYELDGTTLIGYQTVNRPVE